MAFLTQKMTLGMGSGDQRRGASSAMRAAMGSARKIWSKAAIASRASSFSPNWVTVQLASSSKMMWVA